MVVAADATYGSVEAVARHSLFQVVSIVTTTGYASTDFNLWSSSAKHLLFVCMFIGGMAGSTTCSIKTLRWLIVLKAFRRDLFVAAQPSAVRPVRLSGDVVDKETIRDVYAYTLVSLLIVIVSTVFVVVDASRAGLIVTEFEAMGAAAATFFNVGPAFGIVGPNVARLGDVNVDADERRVGTPRGTPLDVTSYFTTPLSRSESRGGCGQQRLPQHFVGAASKILGD